MAKQQKNIYQMKDVLKLRDNTLFVCTEPEPMEKRWLCSEKMGTGWFHQIKIRQGFEIWISECTFRHDTIAKHINLLPQLHFSFVQSGHFQVQYDGAPTVHEFSGEHQGIYFLNSSNHVCTMVGKKPMKSVHVMVYPEFFMAHLDNNNFKIPPPLTCILEPTDQAGTHFNCPLANQPRAIMQQIMECQLTGIRRRLFLESKALELLFLQLENLSNPGVCNGMTCKMHPQDKKQTEHARNYLLSNLETPPCLRELSRSAGMSHPKLNRCFKQMYGMTAFQYLRHERLNRAKGMLEAEGLSVTETAYLVGYDSPSHFSQAFKKQFGASPSGSLRATSQLVV